MSKEPIEKWVDLSGLPRFNGGKGNKINWSQSVGYIIPFKCGDIFGDIKIVGHKTKVCANKNKSMLLVTIDKYVPEPIEIYTNTLIYCYIEKFVKNKIADVAPHLIQYLANVEDAYKYTYCSSKYVLTKCPICGKCEYKNIENLYYHGFSCLHCSDGVSLPNRIMRTVLQQCGVNFIPEVNKTDGFDWMKKYRYDFYFKSKNGDNILIEMDGHFHMLKQQKEIDAIKTNLAINNNFNLIRVDCIYDGYIPFDYIKEHIISSELKNIIPLHLVDWDTCKRETKTSLISEVCRLWEENKMSVSSIKHTLCLGQATVERYLKYGQEVGLCSNYNRDEAYHRRNIDVEKPIMVMDKFNNMYAFPNTKEAIDVLSNIFNITVSKSGLNTACRTHNVYKGLKVQYITKEQYKMINNEVVL